MEDKEAEFFIKEYFNQLFIKINIDSLDYYLHENYWDDDIGDPNVNHIENSKKYLEELLRNTPKWA